MQPVRLQSPPELPAALIDKLLKAFGHPGPATESSKLDDIITCNTQILDMLKAKKEQKYTFSESTAGRDMAVAAASLGTCARNTQLSIELAPLLAAKKELGEGEGLAAQLQLDRDLPPNERLEAVSNTILAWREPNLSYFG
ncbi:TPA: hypothetical protein ACH3X1_004177 [Trebouxia sp. C0004]